jgi:hypothetical protein
MFTITSIIKFLISVFLVLVFQVHSANSIDQISNNHRPENLSDKKWSSLKAAVQEAKLLSSDGTENNQFGYSVSLSGDRALVGARYDEDNGNRSGSAYIYDLTSGVWLQTSKLTADDGAAGDHFGWSVSLSGDRALIGALGGDDNGIDSGSAYVFDLTGGVWSQTSKLNAGDGAAVDNFGTSVSLSGDRALVGALYDDDNGTASGSAYIFELTGGVWLQTSKLIADDGTERDSFGYTVSISGDRALVGAKFDDHYGDWSGSAYIFDLTSGVWSQTSKLIAGDIEAFDNFGNSVSLSGDRALIGANENNGIASGSAYVFDLIGGNWLQTKKFTTDDPAANDDFGYSVSLSGNKALVGAPFDSDNGNGSSSGSAYVFDLTGGVWSQTNILTAGDGMENDVLGYSVSLSGDRTLVGAPGVDDNGIDSGSAYIFEIGSSIFINGFE